MNFDVIYSKTLILRVINSKFNLNQNLFELKEKGTKKATSKAIYDDFDREFAEYRLLVAVVSDLLRLFVIQRSQKIVRVLNTSFEKKWL